MGECESRIQNPNLNKMYETFIRIGPSTSPHEHVFKVIRTEVLPTIRQLEKDGIIDWFSFLIHNKESGVPTTPDDDSYYFHIRISLVGDNDLENLRKALGVSCQMTRKANVESVDHIILDRTGAVRFDPLLRRDERIEDVWRILGGQSEFFLKVFESYKDNAPIPTHEIRALLHYFCNMVGLVVMCPNCETLLLG